MALYVLSLEERPKPPHCCTFMRSETPLAYPAASHPRTSWCSPGGFIIYFEDLSFAQNYLKIMEGRSYSTGEAGNFGELSLNQWCSRKMSSAGTL
ncbi:hypothetical protein AVEN_202327-1 [Araneus ventricosus]|uniref:Uncharacterized protein n=1 Tax=Araneus ventricosus TaxID=182803 RepID=A0A4Y2E5B1_ARAVE|nr:hypothetical protein AVEN_202327-1 [Araneus ventricosus]